MNKIILPFLCVLLLCSAFKVKSQNYYWVAFTDKNNSAFSLDEPEQYLSDRAIQRRIRQNIPVDSLDLPVNSQYIQQVTGLGVKLVHTSKWLNGITVKSEIDSFSMKVEQFPFIKEVQLTKPGLATKGTIKKFNEPESSESYPIDTSVYGLSAYQTSIMNGQFLHNKNYRGEGMQVAILDGGFYHADIYPAFDSLWINNQILGTRDFVNADDSFFLTNYHGMSVLSCMGGNIPGQIIGTAPKASYWLIRSEDTETEYLVEEDNWVAAAEFADSVGCDIINTSLGYYIFDDSQMNHTYADMDGKTTRVTKGANIAFSRGILVFASAGNEGNNSWKHIIAPSDGDNVIAVGAVNRDSIPASFTSVGPASDGDVKPNISAVGWNTYLEKSDGDPGFGSGTSFSSPVMAGMAACLWQARPDATAAEIKEIIEMSSSKFNNPDSIVGYGIPDMSKAWNNMFNLVAPTENLQKSWLAYPNPVNGTLIISTDKPVLGNATEISIYSIDGKLLRKWVKPASSRIELHNLDVLSKGILVLKIKNAGVSETIKLSKLR